MPGQFEVQNPAWQQTLARALEKTAKALGLKNQVKRLKAEIASLRVCRPGDSVDDQQK